MPNERIESGAFGSGFKTVPLKLGVEGPEVGKATVNLETMEASFEILDPLLKVYFFGIHKDVFDISIYAGNSAIPNPVEAILIPKTGFDRTMIKFEGETMSDTSNTQPVDGSPDQLVEELGADPVEINSDGASGNMGPVMVVGATDDASADQIAQEVQATNPTLGSTEQMQVSMPSAPISDTQTDIPTSTEAGDGTDALEPSGESVTPSNPEESSSNTDETISPNSSTVGTDSDSNEGDASEPVQNDGIDSGLTPMSNGGSDITPDESLSDPSVNTEDSQPILQSTTSGIQIEDVPNTSASSTESEDGSTLGDPEMYVGSTPQEPYWPAADSLPDGVEATQVEVKKLLDSEEIQHRFGFHKAAIEGPQASTEVHRVLRHEFSGFAGWLNDGLPAGRETTLMFTALEEASMWAHKAAAKNDPLVQE